MKPENFDESSHIESSNIGVDRTSSTVKGGRRFAFGALVVVGMGTAMISGVVAAIVMIATGGPRSGSGMAVNIVMIALTVVSQGLQATMTAVTYFLLRRGKENADPAALASVFD